MSSDPFSDSAGEPRSDRGTALTSNGLLHAELLAAVASSVAGAR